MQLCPTVLVKACVSFQYLKCTPSGRSPGRESRPLSCGRTADPTLAIP